VYRETLSFLESEQERWERAFLESIPSGQIRAIRLRNLIKQRFVISLYVPDKLFKQEKN